MNGWEPTASLVTDALVEAVPGLVGVYVHGSAALGGWTPTSDLDVLAVVSDDATAVWQDVSDAVLARVAGPVPVELSAVRVGFAARPDPPYPYLLHVASAADKAAVDRGRGDPDLLMHVVATRAAGIATLGPPPLDVFGPVPRDAVLAYLADELAWGLEHADARYAVLNACRAAAYRDEGLVLSKLDGAAWALPRWPHHRATITAARDAQLAGRPLGPADAAARAVVAEANPSRPLG